MRSRLELVMNRKYIGARYVPYITGEWENKEYEQLTVVKYNNATYIAKRYIPSGTSSPDIATEYWMLVVPDITSSSSSVDIRTLKIYPSMTALIKDLDTIKKNQDYGYYYCEQNNATYYVYNGDSAQANGYTIIKLNDETVAELLYGDALELQQLKYNGKFRNGDDITEYVNFLTTSGITANLTAIYLPACNLTLANSFIVTCNLYGKALSNGTSTTLEVSSSWDSTTYSDALIITAMDGITIENVILQKNNNLPVNAIMNATGTLKLTNTNINASSTSQFFNTAIVFDSDDGKVVLENSSLAAATTESSGSGAIVTLY